MRILHIVHLFPPESHGGTQSYVRALAKSQAEQGHEVRVLCGSTEFEDPPGLVDEDDGGLKISRLRRSPAERFSGDLGSERLRNLVTQVAKTHEAELVHLHHWSGLSCDLVRSLKDGGRAVVVTLHDLFTTCARFFRMPDHRRFCSRDVTLDDCARCLAPDLAAFDHAAILTALETRQSSFRAELDAADQVLTVSEAQRALLTSLAGFEDLKAEPFPIGIPSRLEGLNPKRKSPLEEGRLVIGNWGGLDPRKGLHLVVEAVKKTRDPGAYRLEVWGGGLNTDYGREVASAAESIDAVFHGRYADADMQGFDGLMDLAVFPFLAFETYALVVDEALRLGLPVLVSDHGAPPERLGESGLTFANGDIDDLARRLDLLRENPSRLNAMRKASHGALSFEAHCEALQGVYRDALKTGSR